MKQTCSAWLLDLYPDSEVGVKLWFLRADGELVCLAHALPVTFYASGTNEQLRALWRFLRRHPLVTQLARTKRRDLFSGSITVLSVTAPTPTAQRRLFYAARAAFPHLTWYDADVPLPLRYTAHYGVFPLARCQITFEGETLLSLESRASPWEHDPKLPPLRVLSLSPDADPAHQTPRFLHITCDKRTYRLALDPPRPLLISLTATLRSYNPDLILAEWGDTWLLPHLLKLSEQWNIPLPLNRDPLLEVEHRKELSYHAYGQIVYRGQSTFLFGRWHVDPRNAMMFGEYVRNPGYGDQ